MKTKAKISSSQISVVVQGAISGKPDDPYEKRLTYRCLKSLRKHLPEAEIILSTWKGSDVRDLDYDFLVENEDPGAWYLGEQKQVLSQYLHKSYQPSILENPNYTRVLNNVNRQIVSTKVGIERATREFVLKFRSDLLLEGKSFLEYFHRYPMRSDQYKILQDRVLACVSWNPHRFFPFAFHPGDWVFFGRREDVLNIWDIPLMPKPNSIENIEDYHWFFSYYEHLQNHPVEECLEPLDRYTPEQYIWTSFLRKYYSINFKYHSDVSIENLEMSERTIVNNLVLLEPEQLQIKFVKYRFPILVELRFYTHQEWRKIYQIYCENKKKLLVNSTFLMRIIQSFFSSEYEPKLSYRRSSLLTRISLIKWYICGINNTIIDEAKNSNLRLISWYKMQL
jgi:hypothetical protein